MGTISYLHINRMPTHKVCNQRGLKIFERQLYFAQVIGLVIQKLWVVLSTKISDVPNLHLQISHYNIEQWYDALQSLPDGKQTTAPAVDATLR